MVHIDLSLRGKKSDKGNFRDLLKLRVESGDNILKEHFKGAKNAQYTLVRIEHELINIYENVIAREKVKLANASEGFSILADKTADITGIKQLSFGIRFASF